MTRKGMLALALSLLAAVHIYAYTETVDGIEWTYQIYTGKAYLGGGSFDSPPAVPTTTTGNITIPSALGGYPVTSIGSYAFYRCCNLTGLSIPDGVTSIGNSAFYGCSGLTSVTIGNSVTSIGDRAFSYCRSLTSVTIGNSVTSIGDRAFSDCTGLTSVTIPDSVTSIGDRAFEFCSGLTSVTIGNSVTSIGNHAFSRCTGLTSVTIGNSVTSIGDDAFGDCSGLTSVTIPDSVTNIGDSAFSHCSGLLSVIIPDSVNSIGSGAFEHCSGLTSVTIPSGVTSINNWAFEHCSGLKNVTMAGDAPEVGYSAFDGVTNGCVVSIPRSASGYEVTDGMWQGMVAEYYGPEAIANGTIRQTADGYVATAAEGETLAESDFAFGEVSRAAYSIDIAADGKSAVVSLKSPVFGVAAGDASGATRPAGSDPSGALVEVAEELITAKPDVTGDEKVGALPMKTYPGLYYQAAWGNDLGAMTSGEKVKATGDGRYLGVVRQTGESGFYRLSVSEK